MPTIPTRLLTAACVAAFAVPGVAQETKPTTQPAQPPVAGPQGPEIPSVEEEKAALRPLTAEERISRLQKQLASRQRELSKLQEIIQSNGLLKDLQERTQPQPIEAETVKVQGPTGIRRPTPETNTNRVISTPAVQVFPDEMADNLPADVIATIDGAPITKGEVDTLFAFFGTAFPGMTEDIRKKQAMREAMRVALPRRLFQATNADSQKGILAIEEELRNGADFAEVAKARSGGTKAEEGGDLGWLLRTGPRSVPLRAQAFRLEKGQTSPVFETLEGYVILKCTDKTTDDQGTERIRVSRILIPYVPDLQQVMRAQLRLNTGQAQVMIRDASVKAWLPPPFDRTDR